MKLRKLSKIITTSNFSAPNATCRDFQEKRSSYPRLYFLSDEDLLELVSASGRGLEVHLPKLYQGVGSIIRDDNGLTAVVSPEGEILQLSKPVDLRDPLSQWLSNLEERMKSTLRQHLEKCLVDTAPDPSVYPTQVKENSPDRGNFSRNLVSMFLNELFRCCCSRNEFGSLNDARPP